MPMNKSLRAAWKKAGYGTKMGSSCVVPPPSKRFRRVYHILPAPYALDDIKRGRLKVARYKDLNDPFELLAYNLKNSAQRQRFNRFKRLFHEYFGLLCFSRDWTNPVLWSHYGAKHCGICLGFNVERRRLTRVRYVSERLTYLPNSVGNSLNPQWIETKFDHWKYEAERRHLVTLNKTVKDGDLHFFPFDEGMELAEVIVGPNCTTSLEDVRRLVKRRYPNAVTFKARIAWGHFKVVPHESTVP